MRVEGLAAIVTAAIAVLGSPAQAANVISYLASTGGGTTCTKAAPCAQMQAAIDATSTNGEIIVLDSGDFADGQINCKNLTITGTDGAIVYSTAASSQTLAMFCAADMVVTIRNLTFEGRGVGLFGIRWAAVGPGIGGTLIVENCVIQNYTGPSGPAGIRFEPTRPSRLVVKDTTITNNGSGGQGGGIVVHRGSALIALERVTLAQNAFGVALDGTNMNATMTNSTVSTNGQYGVIATGSNLGIMLKGSSITNNSVGVGSFGTNVTVRVDGSTIIGNGTGLSFSGGGALLTYGNNNVDANGNNGAFSGSVALK